MSRVRVVRMNRQHWREGDAMHDAFLDQRLAEPSEPGEVVSASPDPYPILYGPRGGVLVWGVDRELAGFRLRGEP